MPWRPKQHRPHGVQTKRTPRTKEQQKVNSEIYNYRWRQFSKRYLADNPLCVDHLEAGIVAEATEVHHKVKVKTQPELQFEESNLMALCEICHSKRTARGE